MTKTNSQWLQQSLVNLWTDEAKNVSRGRPWLLYLHQYWSSNGLIGCARRALVRLKDLRQTKSIDFRDNYGERLE